MEPYFLFHRGVPEAVREEEEDIGSPSESESLSTSRDSAGSSSELDDDASSSGSDHHRRFEMSSLMTQLPLKRGLSRFFDGKSQSFASLAAVGSLEDLAKPLRKRPKPSRCCGGGLDAHRGRLLSPRRHCTKAAAGAGSKKVVATHSVLGAAPRRPPLAMPARPEGVAGKVLVVN
ncbi:protein OXIDATIVE STRESS 3-like [Phragmites australis]|uniref:protein OXIDATIVE STRESS 3-like n=1 Tax=Phragmites australis TaxID=29695 RepID=UPI002D779637|nr:protein OXIDATIVE STRESS 3-like [Phragmites australis]